MTDIQRRLNWGRSRWRRVQLGTILVWGLPFHRRRRSDHGCLWCIRRWLMQRGEDLRLTRSAADGVSWTLTGYESHGGGRVFHGQDAAPLESRNCACRRTRGLWRVNFRSRRSARVLGQNTALLERLDRSRGRTGGTMSPRQGLKAGEVLFLSRLLDGGSTRSLDANRW